MLVIAASISASVGFGVVLSSDAAAINHAALAIPHCGTSRSSQACCTGCSLPFWASELDGGDLLPEPTVPTGILARSAWRTPLMARCRRRIGANAATVFGAGQSDRIADGPQSNGVSDSTSTL